MLNLFRVLAAATLLMLPAVSRAQIFIEHIEPPVFEKGKTTRVTLVGENLANALDIWSSLPTGALKTKLVESKPDRAIFDIEATANAPVGIAGLRVATRDGLSNTHLFLIDDLPVRAGDAGALKLPAAVWGTFREGQIERYSIEVKAGQGVSFETVGSRFGKDADPLVTIRDSHGKWIAERDNDQGLYYDCRFEHQFKEAGVYVVEIRDSRFHGSEHHQYVLRMGRFPTARVAMPSARKSGPTSPDATFFTVYKDADDEGSTWLPVMTTELPILTGSEEPLPATIPSVLCGVLKKPGDRHSFTLELAKGQALSLRGEAQAINSPAELEIVLTDKMNKEVRRATEMRGEWNLEYAANALGTFHLLVRDSARDGSEEHAYRIKLSDKPFPPVLQAEVEGLVVPQGAFQPFPISVTRSGASGPIKLKLLGAPAGLTLTPDEIGEKETAIVCKLQAAADVPLGLFTLQILAEAQQGPVLARTQPLIDKQLINVDLILHALREDQRRLPPSVTDRFALQITPPSPFTMELLEPVITLARYQQADIPIVTTRQPGFDGPITFTAKGGQLWDKKEGRTRVYAEFPDATSKELTVSGTVHAKILSNLTKARIEVTGSGMHNGRLINLTRTFELNLTAAFAISADPAKLSLLPGEKTSVTFRVDRLKTFDGEVTIKLSPVPGVKVPETVIVPKGQSSTSITVELEAGAAPRKQNVQLTATGAVNGFEEQVRSTFEIDVRKK